MTLTIQFWLQAYRLGLRSALDSQFNGGRHEGGRYLIVLINTLPYADKRWSTKMAGVGQVSHLTVTLEM